MTLVWQYGSNMDQARLNSPQRLRGNAKYVGLAIKRGYILGFPRSNRKKIGTAGIVEGRKDNLVIGALYDVPDDCIECFDAIEGTASGSYERFNDFEVEAFSDNLKANRPGTVKAVTYLANAKPGEHPTSANYANHILRGILDYDMPRDYFEKTKETILKNNPHLRHELISFECPFCRFRVKFMTTHFGEGKNPACEAWIDFEYDEDGELAWYAILNGNQYTTGHSIVVLGTHRRSIMDQSLTDEEAASIVHGATRVARRLK
ncbi:MAG: gamma-glutamylcyclotransferase, partial [Thermoplasmata archaeon]|nr:gamma-glutamylcyclotransferase [Thermoplasmata archaeon]